MKKTLLKKKSVFKIFRFYLGSLVLLFVSGLSFAHPVNSTTKEPVRLRPVSISPAQEFTVSGTVKDEKGVIITGVTVKLKGTVIGTVTDISGNYHINVPDGNGTLVFSFIGFQTQEVAINGNPAINIILKEASSNLAEVVVTALGIKQSKQSLTYATQQFSSESINTVKTDNLMNALSGKIAGVTISPSASGVGGSTKVLLRGNRSFAGNNQPLYVIDGVPMANPSNAPQPNANTQPTKVNGQPNDNYGGSTDGGDGISNLNPEDIESITILEGASASALYGSQASNGVILVTTKKGKAGKMQINFSSSFQASNAVSEPKFQNQYGATTTDAQGNITGDGSSWGTSISGSPKNNLKEFFQTGTNFTNAISLSGGSDIAQSYFSYANTTASGIEPKNDLKRDNFNLRETAKLLNNKLTVDGSVNYIDQKTTNSPALGIYLNPLMGLYLFPRGANILPFKNQYSYVDPVTSLDAQSWPVIGGPASQQNPWWTINKDGNVLHRSRFILNSNARYDFTSWFNVQVRGSLDRTNDNYEQDVSSGTIPGLNPGNRGLLVYNSQATEQKYGDIIVNFTAPKWGQSKLDGLIGASVTDLQINGVSNNGPLSTPNYFSANNIFSGGVPIPPTPFTTHTQTQAIFESANLSYKNWVYLALTNRTEWNSTLAFTPNERYNYPSAGLTFILSQMFAMPKAISYAKVRGSYADVGNGVPFNVTLAQNTQDGTGALLLNGARPLQTLKPESTHSFELGTDWKFIDNRINFTFTYYNTHTYNQYFSLTPAAPTLISTAYVNAGDIQNKGIEITLGADVIRGKGLTWNTSFNASINKNKIIDVDAKDGLTLAELSGTDNGSFGFRSVMANGGSYADIYGNTMQRNASGQIVLSGTDPTKYAPQKSNSGLTYLGNPSPKFQLGWNNSFDFGPLNLSFLVDGKFGGKVVSFTEAEMDYFGVSRASAGTGPNRQVIINGVNAAGQPVTSINAQNWYQATGSFNPITDQYVYSATVVRLREASLGYTWPITNSAVKSIKFSLIGRNLAYFYKKAPFDPEVTTSTGNGLAGIDVFNQPATRNLGFSVNVNF